MSQVIGESQAEKGQSTFAKSAGVGTAAAGAVSHPTADEHHIDHGHAPARAVACLIAGFGFLIGGLSFAFQFWPLVVICGALEIVAVVVNLAMNAAGLGAKANRDWAAAKDRAAAARAAAA